MLKKLGMVLTALGISVLLSGCLVDKKDPADIETIASATPNLHIYQDQDQIDYDITVVTTSNSPPTTLQGVMTVLWEQTPNLSNPIDGSTIGPVLKETTTITYDPATGPDVIVVRYISQDPNGRMILHAIDDTTGILYWPYADGQSFPTSSTVTTPTIFDSPMAIGTPPANSGTSHIIAECSSSLCNSQIYKFRDDSVTVVGNTTVITTPKGKFSNPFQIRFAGGIGSTGTLAIEFLGDIRDACGTSKETINHGEATGAGTLYVFPEIGIIKMENACTVIGGGSGASVLYTATLRNTNISLP